MNLCARAGVLFMNYLYIYLFIYYLICECRAIKVPEAWMVPKELKEDRLVLSVTCCSLMKNESISFYVATAVMVFVLKVRSF